MNKEQQIELRDGKRSRRNLTFYEVRRIITQTLFGRVKKRREMKGKTKTLIFIWAGLALPIINWLVFWLYVNFNSILLAFKNIDYSGGGIEYWTLNNFKTIYKMFTEPGEGTNLLHYGGNTLKYWLLSVFMIPHSILLTYVFQKKLKGHKFYRVLLYMPQIISATVLAGVFQSFVSQTGALAYILKEYFHVARVPSWFNETMWVNKALLFYQFFFGFAGQYILYSGAMARIPEEIHEAAALDGITMWQEIWYIDIPLMWPTISMTMITTFAGLFGASGPILLFTQNFEYTFTWGYFIFDQVRQYGSYYIPAALGLSFTLVAFPISLLIKKLLTSIYSDVD